MDLSTAFVGATAKTELNGFFSKKPEIPPVTVNLTADQIAEIQNVLKDQDGKYTGIAGWFRGDNSLTLNNETLRFFNKLNKDGNLTIPEGQDTLSVALTTEKMREDLSTYMELNSLGAVDEVKETENDQVALLDPNLLQTTDNVAVTDKEAGLV